MNLHLLLYIGPGAGIEVIGALWALIATLGAAFGVILLAPIRALIRRIRDKRRDRAAGDGQPENDEEKRHEPPEQ